MELVSAKDEFQPNFFKNNISLVPFQWNSSLAEMSSSQIFFFFFLMRKCELVGLISMELVFSRDEFQSDFFFF
jgi:hypothetical protein